MVITGEDHLVSPHPVVHVQHRSHGGRARDAVGAASPRHSRGESSSSRSHHAHSFSNSRSAVAYSRSSSTSSDEDCWPLTLSPSARSTSMHNNSNGGSGSSGGISSTGTRSGRIGAHTSLRLAFRGRGGNGRGERADAGGGDQIANGARGCDNNHGQRRSSLFLSLLDSEGSSRSRSIEHCLEAPEPSFSAMLPGVEVARRRRVRLADTYEGSGGGFGGGGQEAGQSSRSSRSSGVTVAHHHHYHHHHHHHHVHHQAARHPSRPGTPRPGSLVRRMQDILQEHRSRNPFQHFSSSSSSSSTDRTIPVEVNAAPQSSSHRSSRGHRVAEGESRIASLWRRQTSSSSSNLRGAALEARNRLDERLRAAAHANHHHSRRSWQAVQSSYDMNFLFSDDEDDNIWSDDDGGETSLNEWLAVWAPAAWAPSSVEERWNRMESSGSARASSSRNPTFKPRPSEGLSKAAINALPRQVVGSSRTLGGGSNRSKMEQEDCPVCLEGFLQGQSLMALPCNHRFHPECLTPWLTNHGQCPYCRADIVKDIDTSSEQKSASRLMGGSDEELLSWVEAIERGMDRLSYS